MREELITMTKRIAREVSPPLHSTGPAASSIAVMDPAPPIESGAPPVNGSKAAPSVRKTRQLSSNGASHHFSSTTHEEHGSNNQAELFYLQKQIQLQTQMVFILEDGVRVQGVIEWYDRNSIKVRGKSRVLLYKSAVKYLFKAGEVGSAPE